MNYPFLPPLGDDSHPLEPSMQEELEECIREDELIDEYDEDTMNDDMGYCDYEG